METTKSIEEARHDSGTAATAGTYVHAPADIQLLGPEPDAELQLTAALAAQLAAVFALDAMKVQLPLPPAAAAHCDAASAAVTSIAAHAAAAVAVQSSATAAAPAV